MVKSLRLFLGKGQEGAERGRKGRKRKKNKNSPLLPFTPLWSPLVQDNRNNIDTDNNKYLSERVGKCNRLDKCGYHYTPREYFTDNPWLKEKRNECSFIQNHRVNERMNANTPPRPICTLIERNYFCQMQRSLALQPNF